jgi:hypothetical protein
VWLLWLIAFGLISGVLQAYDLQKHRHTESQTFGQSFGSYFSSTAYEQTFSSSFSYTTHEQFYDTVLQGPPPRTMLAPLLDFHYTVGGWTSSRSTTGSMYDSFSTTSAFGQWRVYRFQFPPAYVPIWLAAMIRLVRRRGGEADR